MHSPRMPQAPDPMATAQAQMGMNIGSAIGTQLTNATNQVTPQGSLTYSQNGYRSWTDPGSGKTYQVPILTATQTYSPEQQKLYQLGNQMQQNIGQIGVDQSKKIGQLLSQPLNLDDRSIDDKLYSLYSPRIQSMQGKAAEQLNSQLAAEGITRGSAAYDDALTRQGQLNTDQWQQMLLNGRQQAIQQMMTQRQEPINEITALLSGSQVTNPTYGSTPTTSIASPDYQGAVANNYAGQMQAYNSQLNQQNAIIGGLSGIAGDFAGGWARSDRRIKTDVERIGTLPSGIPWYLFHYVGEPTDAPLREGVMAQDVMFIRPDAVRMTESGYYEVDYRKVLQ